MSALCAGRFRLYCYILKKSKASFHVDLAEGGLVDHLKEAILRKNDDILVDVDGLNIWKYYLPAKDLVTQLANLQLSDEDALDGPELLSSVFSDAPLGQIHVLAEVPDDPRPRKKARLGSTWDVLWRTFWGNLSSDCLVKGSARIPDPRTLETPTEETKYEYLKLPDDLDFPCGLQRILITETYKSLATLLCEQDEAYTKLLPPQRLRSLLHSTIITGQPGSGKTVGLSCILVWRLQRKKPTVYCDEDACAYVLTSAGATPVSLSGQKRIKELDESTDCCALVDINPNLTKIPSQFRPSRVRQGRVVIATTPNPHHIVIFKQYHAKTYFTPTWKWVDLYCASLLQPIFMDPKSLRDAYTKLAGIPRRCFRALSQAGDAYETRIIREAINDIHDADNFAKAAPFKASHALVRIEPTDNTWTDQTTELLSDFVADLVFDRLNLLTTLKIRDSMDYLLRNPNALGWGDKLFETAVHRAFRKGIEFEPEAMDDDAPSLRVRIKKAETEGGGYFHTISVRAEKGSHKVGNEFLNQYLIPLSSTAETIDAVDIEEGVTVLFQMTVSPTHVLNLKGITELTDELPSFAKKRICIAFVVPDHDTTRKPYTRQGIGIPHGVAKDVSDPVVAYNQYVYYFPMDKL